jgi:DNA polymerase-3 subunit delta'
MWQVVGQGRNVSLLKHSLERGTLAHAYLLVGPHNVGKMTLALNLAQALNCEANEHPCGVCTSCQKITLCGHADVQVIGLIHDGNSAEIRNRVEISIDQIRDMQHSSNLPPFEGKYKVFIIDGAELLSTEAANCLLKTLEEPNGNVVFILLTANEKLLPITVVSRCQRLALFPLAVGEMEDVLYQRWHIEPQKAKLLARLSHGRLGWAVSAASGDSLLEQRAERLERLISIIDADYEERFIYVKQLTTLFRKSREMVQEILELWLDWWRDIMLVKAGCIDGITNVDSETILVKIAGGYPLAKIRAFIGSIQAAGEQLRQNANPQLVLEVLMLNIPGRKYG